MAAMTRSKRGRKLLQAFLTKFFFMDAHARFTETFSSSVLLWRVLQALVSICALTLKSRGFKSGDCEGKRVVASNGEKMPPM